jgi:hypothetical protein
MVTPKIDGAGGKGGKEPKALFRLEILPSASKTPSTISTMQALADRYGLASYIG